MGKLIGTNTSDNFGEKLFVDKAIEYLDDSCIIYRNRQVYGREFDVCILMPGKGILVVELKGWKEESVLRGFFRFHRDAGSCGRAEAGTGKESRNRARKERLNMQEMKTVTTRCIYMGSIFYIGIVEINSFIIFFFLKIKNI